MPADGDGFVRVAVGFANPGEQPQSETYLYKGYKNEFGQPLVVVSNNQNLSSDVRLASIVTIDPQPGLALIYYFDNRKFPKEAWWSLYQRVLRFIRLLQAPN